LNASAIGYQVEMGGFTEWEIFQQPEIHVHQCRALQGITPEARWSRGERERAAAAGINACKRVNRTAALGCKNRRRLDMPEDPCDPVLLDGLARLLVADGQFP